MKKLAERIKKLIKPHYDYDLVCFTNKGTKDWILGAICREIVATAKVKATLVIHSKNEPPTAGKYFYSNWYSYVEHYHNKTLPEFGSKLVYFTHPRETKLGEDKILEAFNTAHKVIFMSSLFMNEYIAKGLKPKKAVAIAGAADPNFFKPHKRTGQGAVGFCSAYYERKNPQLIYDIAKAMPKHKFMLLGKNWQQFPQFTELQALPNFTYIDDQYKNYPKYYNQMDVFISPALLEGGPIPLIEAMMSNVYPVASMTGFAPDIIKHGKNGLLFDAENIQLKDLCTLIEKAFLDVDTDIRATTRNLTWDAMAANLVAL